MGQKTKKGKGRLDKYYHLAKEQGYRSRAAFKLIQLNRKYNFLGKCRALLDLCAAPGGWLQVAAKNMPMGSLIIGVDLVPIKPIRGAKTLIGDITTQATRAALKREARGNMFDVVVHDGAPNVGGAWATEAHTQSALVLDSLKLATEFLVPKGTFVTKVFRSKDYNALLYAFNQLFEKVEATKPTASRNTSAEIFVVCLGYKAPAKIDPRLLDPRHLFQEVTDAPRVMGPEALMKEKIKQRRHREGYEEGLSTTHKTISALAFLVSAAPVEMLGKATQIALDGPNSWQPVEGLHSTDLKELADKVRRHASTDEEIRVLCKDLQVLGRTEFKALLRWRTTVCKALADDLAAAGMEGEVSILGKRKKTETAKTDGDETAPADAEAALLAEMEKAREAAAKREKKEKKKLREMKKKARIRAAQLGATQGIIDDNGPDEMFSLKNVDGDGKTLSRVANVRAPGDKELELLDLPDSSDEEYGGQANDDDSDVDSELRYEMELDEALEQSYKSYLERKGHRDDVRREKRRRLGMDLELDEEEDGEQKADKSEDESDMDEETDDPVMTSDQEGADVYEDDDEDQGEDEDEEEEKQVKGKQKRPSKPGAGLLVELDEGRAGVAKTAPAMAAQWFGQELFDDPNLVEDDDEEEEDDDMDDDDIQEQSEDHDSIPAKQQKAKASKDSKSSKAATANSNGTSAAAAASALMNEDDSDVDEAAQARRSNGSGFEVVPLAKEKSSKSSKGGSKADDSDADSGTDSEDEFDLLDDQGKAEVLALAKRMLRRKEKESIIDAAYNRYAFHDTGLPRWFVEDERHHMRPIMPITKEEVEAEKARLRAIDARPIKKIAEAKGRQKRRSQAKLQQAREKAEAIAAQEDVPLNSKMREIEKLYARARASAKKGKGKGKDKGKGKGGKDGKRKGPPLDKRMLKDKRAQKRIQKKGGKGKGGKAGGRKGR